MHPLATRLHPQHCLWGKEPLSPHLNVTDEAPSSTHWPMGGKNEMEEGGKKHSDFLRWQLSLLRIWPRPGPGSVPAPAAVWVCCPPLLTPFFFVSVSPSSLPPPNPNDRKEDVKEADLEKEAALEAELKAARERAVMPLDVRMTQFRDMLLERGVKHFNRNTSVTSSVMLDT